MKILLACGGTGGHLFPAIGLWHTLGQRDKLFFVTGKSPLEEELLPEGKVAVERIPREKISFLQALKQSSEILKKLSPEVVIGFGSYASVPVLLAARCRGVPVIIHEQNMIPGRANRWLSGCAKGIAVSFPQTIPLWKRRQRVKMTGNPGPLRWKDSEENPYFLKQLKLAPERMTLLIMGGSQGAHQINVLMAETIPRWLNEHPEQRRKVQLVHLTGDLDFEPVRQSCQKFQIPFFVAPFYREMDQLYRVSHLVIGRAGATSLAELSYFGLPAILIPYPYAGAHQLENAKIFEQEGAAVVLNGEMATADSMSRSLHTLVCSGERLRRMREASRRLAVPDAQERLREFIEEVI